jgi:hypothetical protein
MSTKTGRVEKRTQIAVSVELWGTQDRGHGEKALTENVSARGARVVTQRALQTQEGLLLNLMGNSSRTQARVIYCQPLASGLFSVGLHFLEAPLNWRVPSDIGLAEKHRKEG